MDNPKQGGRVLAIPMASGAKVEPEAARWRSKGGAKAEWRQSGAKWRPRRQSEGGAKADRAANGTGMIQAEQTSHALSGTKYVAWDPSVGRLTL